MSDFKDEPVNAIAIEPVQSVRDYDYSGKQGHKCCGCCCDVRRAVFIVDLISVIIQILGMATLPALVAFSNNPGKYVDDDEKAAEIESEDLPWGFMLTIMILSLIAYLGGCYGAVKYNQLFIGIAAGFYILNIIFTFINAQNFGYGLMSSILPACFAYPHFVLIQEIRSGIMTPTNYKNEEYSCCCI